MSTTRREPPTNVELPRRALIVSDRPDAAAVLAGGFDDARIIAPADLERALSEDPEPACVGITGVASEDGQLRQVIERVLGQGADGLTVFVDVTDPVGLQLVHLDATPLAGLTAVGRTSVAGVDSIVFTRGASGASPDLSEFRDGPEGVWSVRERAFSEAERLAADHNERTLQRRIAELEAELKKAHPAPAARAAAPAKPSPAPSTRNRKLAIAAAGLLVVVAVAVALALSTSTGYVGGLLTAACVFGAGVALYVIRAHRRLARAVSQLRSEVRHGAAAEQAHSTQLSKRLNELLGTDSPAIVAVERQLEQVGTSSVDIARTLRNLSTGLQLPEIDARQRKAYSDAAHQTQAVANLFSMLPVDAVVPLMGGWAASADVVVALVDELLSRKPRIVVECGSGVSTLWLALAIRKYGLDTRIVCLEHDARFGAATREVLDRHGVGDLVEVRDAPLGPTGIPGHDTAWYDVAALDGLQDIGLLFVDGPPEATGPLVRYPAVPLLRERFAAQVTIVLDDLIRPMEQEITKRWQQELPDFTVQRLPLEKGASVFRRG